MQIHNIRYGFATNSSSSHSIVLLPGARTSTDECDGDQEYGWGAFTLADEQSKMEYLGQLLLSQFGDKSERLGFASELTGVALHEGYIDHQSVLVLPKLPTGELNVEFAQDLKRYLLRDDVVILGGNDNSGEHPMSEVGKLTPASQIPDHGGTWTARKDPAGFWTLFCARDGRKVRLSFDDGVDAGKSSLPELVDLKITDFCAFGCKYCYQGSTVDGKHADFRYLKKAIVALGSIGCFEVAIGGGEPTAHPRFLDILRLCVSNGVSPSFSTRNLAFVKKHAKQLQEIGIKAVGFSVDSQDGAMAALTGLSDLGLNVVLQLAHGSCSAEETKSIMDLATEANRTVLLLGFKRVGRGLVYSEQPFDLSGVLNQYIGKSRWGGWGGPSLSFDTVMVQNMRPWLETHTNSIYWTAQDGDHSMYIDAVTKSAGANSYTTNLDPITGDIETFIRENFPKY